MGKVYTAEQFRKWDEYTIRHKPISSISLMENAADAFVDKFLEILVPNVSVAVFCGPGNNGGDGLAIARKLVREGMEVAVYLLSKNKGSKDYETNLKRFKKIGKVNLLNEDAPLPKIKSQIIIDAIFGTGLNKPVTGFYEKVIKHINIQPKHLVFSVDIPSGMYADKSSKGNEMIKAMLTLTFGGEKLAFFMPENGGYTGDVITLDIGLLPFPEPEEKNIYETIDIFSTSSILQVRNQFSNKGNYGNACLIAGSYGMMGAATLSAMGCLRSGVGKLTCFVCRKGYEIMQIRVPEAMCKVFGDEFVANIAEMEHYDVIGVGPGLGRHSSHVKLLESIFATQKPIVIDADALNVMSENRQLLDIIPAGSILTPHPKEFERLFGKTKNDFDEREMALKMADRHNIIIVLKGRYTCIAVPDGKIFINQTGNPGMATGGSGDVLTGILTGLLAQGYTSRDAAILGVYLHGISGDIAAQNLSEESMIASDICKYLGKAFLKVKNWSDYFE